MVSVLLLPTASFAAGEVTLAAAENDVSNVPSLQRGARNFVNFCMGCHSAKYVRYNRLARDLGISEDQLIANLMFAAEKPQETMTVAMPEDDAARWFGQAPPDLSLVARSRGADFVYSFLRSFYLEEESPTGVNNLGLELVRPGSLSPEEYDRFVRDIVNFLDYVGEPMQLERTRLGVWVILFLLVFGVLSWLLKEEIWKDIK
jgi:ubiquinol-cytochrome c reductase cytochrome c1 subunit